MGPACIAIFTGTLVGMPPASALTLRWVHSVEHVAWEEDYVARDGLLHLREARVRMSGAGMEIPPGARWNGRSWAFVPAVGPLREVVLANSRHVAGYTVCIAGERCVALASIVPRGTQARIAPAECGS